MRCHTVLRLTCTSYLAIHATSTSGEPVKDAESKKMKALQEAYKKARMAFAKFASLRFDVVPNEADRQLAADIVEKYGDLGKFCNWAFKKGLGACQHIALCTSLLRDMEGRTDLEGRTK